MEAQKARLESLRDSFAALSAKRQGRLFRKGGEAYNKARQDYNNQVITYGKLTHKELIEDETISELDKNKQIVEYLFAEQNALREASLEKLQGTKVHKYITKFAELMDHEKRSVRILKSVALGVGVGAAVTLAGGLVAGGAAVAGAGALGLKFARAYAQREAKAGRGIQMLDDADKQKVLETPVEPELTIDNLTEKRNDAPVAPNGFEELQTRFDDWMEVDTHNEQANRRRSVAIAMGTVAAGVAIGHTLASTLGDIVAGYGGGTTEPNPTEPIDIYPEPDTEPDGTIEEEVTPAPDAEAPQPAPEFIPDARFNVPDGQGGIWLFQNMGLTETDWYSVHHELLTRFPEEFYSEGGDVRFAHAGQLSQGAQEFIKSRFAMA
jgi:hypothetical protein